MVLMLVPQLRVLKCSNSAIYERFLSKHAILTFLFVAAVKAKRRSIHGHDSFQLNMQKQIMR